MRIFQNRFVLTLGALLALLVFSGDVLDDVWNIPGSTATIPSSHPQKGGAPKASFAGHDDTVAIASPSVSPAPVAPRVLKYLDVDEDTPVGAPPEIDHPPQLA